MKQILPGINPDHWKRCALAEMDFAAGCALVKFYGISSVYPMKHVEKLRQCITAKMGWIITPNHETHKADLAKLSRLVLDFEYLRGCTDDDEIVTFGSDPAGAARDGFKQATKVHYLIFKYNPTMQSWIEQNRKKK